METATQSDGTKKTRWVKLAAVLVGIGILLYLARQVNLGRHLETFGNWVDGQGAFGPIAFIGLYAGLTILAVPGSMLTLGAGIIFGLAKGTAYAFAGALLGSTGAFLVSRYIARGWIEKRISADPRLVALDRALEEQGLKIMTLLRLSPVFPFIFLNFALGLTKVKLRDYVLAGFAMLPGALLYVYYGFVIGDLTKVAAGGGVDKDWKDYLILTVGLVLAVVVTAFITRIAKRSYREAAQQPEEQDDE